MSREEVLAKAIKDGVHIEGDRFMGVAANGMIFENSNLAKQYAKEKNSQVYIYSKDELQPEVKDQDVAPEQSLEETMELPKQEKTKQKAKNQ